MTTSLDMPPREAVRLLRFARRLGEQDRASEEPLRTLSEIAETLRLYIWGYALVSKIRFDVSADAIERALRSYKAGLGPTATARLVGGNGQTALFHRAG